MNFTHRFVKHSFAAAFSAAMLTSSAQAVWKYSRIIDSAMATLSGSTYSSNISIESGNVVGLVTYGGGAGTGVYKANATGPFQTVVKTGNAAPSGTFSAFSTPTIGGGLVTYRGTYGANASIFLDNGTTRSVVASVGDSTPVGAITSFGTPRTNGTMVAFNATSGGNIGIYTKTGTTLTALNTTSDTGPGGSAFTGFGNPFISGNNVAYQGFNSQFANYFWNGSTRTTMLTQGTSIAGFGVANGIGQPALSGSKAAFLVNGAGSTQGVFSWNGGVLSLIAKTGDAAPIGTFSTISSSVAINGNLVVFAGSYGTNKGIFIGDGVKRETIIKTGDTLFGSTVTSLGSPTAIDDMNRVAFTYTLANGQTGVALAVPEPGSMVALGLGALALLRRRRNKSL